MNRSPRFWRIAAVLFLVVNAGGAVLAFVQGEQMHAEMHLALFGAAFVGYVFSRAAQSRNGDPLPLESGDQRVGELQRSVDAMSLELERLGEAQRYRERLEVERKEKSEG